LIYNRTFGGAPFLPGTSISGTSRRQVFPEVIQVLLQSETSRISGPYGFITRG